MKKIFLSFIIFLCAFLAINYSGNNVFASELSEVDYSSLSQLNIINENNIFGVDEANNKIIKITQGKISSFGEYGTSDGKFAEIKFFKVLSNNELIVIDGLKRLQFFDTNFNHLKTIQYVQYIDPNKNIEQHSLIGNITSICCDLYANVYLLDASNNQIIKANSQSTYAEIYKTNIDSSIEIINFNINGTLILANTNTFYCESLSHTLEENISEIYVDAQNYIFVKSPQNLYKFNTSLTQESSMQLPENCSYLSINLEKGIFYYLNTNTLEILKIENFASDVSNFTPPYDISEKTAQSKKTNFAKITKECYLYSTPYQISSNIYLTKDIEIIVLSENFDSNLNFTYVMTVNNNQVILGYIKSDCYLSTTDKNYNSYAFPIRNDIPYYKLPLKAYSNTSLKLNRLNFNEVYAITQKIIFNNVEFYEIKINENYVFVESKNVLENVTNYISVYLQTDAVVKPINSEENVTIYSNENKDDILYIIEKPLNVKAIKKVSSLYEIQFLQNNEIKIGYVESANLFKDKNNFIIPIVIALVIICLIIISIILIKFKKEFKRNI